MSQPVKRVVIVGGGFAGLYAARALADVPVAITLVDRRNHHVFQPLLYQVATAGLSPGDIAVPIRSVVRDQANVRVLLGEASAVDLAGRRVHLIDGADLPFDYLILATGARPIILGGLAVSAVAGVGALLLQGSGTPFVAVRLAGVASAAMVMPVSLAMAATAYTGIVRATAIGVAYALGAGLCWALYIVFGRRAGAAHGGQITALGTAIGAVMIVPIGYAHSGAQLFSPSLLPIALGVDRVAALVDEGSTGVRVGGAHYNVAGDIHGCLGARDGTIVRDD